LPDLVKIRTALMDKMRVRKEEKKSSFGRSGERHSSSTAWEEVKLRKGEEANVITRGEHACVLSPTRRCPPYAKKPLKRRERRGVKVGVTNAQEKLE